MLRYTNTKPDVCPEPIGLPPKEAFRLIGCGITYGYDLLKQGELQSYWLGRARRVTTASIKLYIERKLAEAASRPGAA